jgi:hypothetical protein
VGWELEALLDGHICLHKEKCTVYNTEIKIPHSLHSSLRSAHGTTDTWLSTSHVGPPLAILSAYGPFLPFAITHLALEVKCSDGT